MLYKGRTKMRRSSKDKQTASESWRLLLGTPECRNWDAQPEVLVKRQKQETEKKSSRAYAHSFAVAADQFGRFETWLPPS